MAVQQLKEVAVGIVAAFVIRAGLTFFRHGDAGRRNGRRSRSRTSAYHVPLMGKPGDGIR
jgi:hypothetical protein